MKFANRMKDIIRKNLTNKQLFPDRTSEERSVMHTNLDRIKNDIETKFSLVGQEVYAALMKNKQRTIGWNSIEIKDLLLEIMQLQKQISETRHS